jgi:UDP-sulfoquinovose synthase
MRICVLGGDGYLGWPTSLYLSSQGHEILIIDNCVKRRWEASVGVSPLLPVPAMSNRVCSWRLNCNQTFEFLECDISFDYDTLETGFKRFSPEVIVHYAEQPSAPFSMASRMAAIETQRNNTTGTLNVIYACRAACPDAHIIKLGTMGEYGTPNLDIEEGWLDIKHNGRHDRVLFPKKPTSMYHLSKVHDSLNLEFACRTWGLRVTDLNQGIVYGTQTDGAHLSGELRTSFHYDAVFGTIINRFLVQAAIGVPLTIYGSGSKVRGVIDINDTIRCIEIAAQNPSDMGEFRVFNQVTACFSLNELTALVQAAGRELGLEVTKNQIPNPRIEAEEHYYNPKYTALERLGLRPRVLAVDVAVEMLEAVMRHRERVDPRHLLPGIAWGNNFSVT